MRKCLLFFVVSCRVKLIDDPLQLTRFRVALEGNEAESTSSSCFHGLLHVVRHNQSLDAKKSYQCVKLIVSLANK